MTTEPWMNKRTLARRLNVSVSTIERLHLPHMRVGGQNRYRMSEVERALRQTERADNVVELRPPRAGEAA